MFRIQMSPPCVGAFRGESEKCKQKLSPWKFFPWFGHHFSILLMFCYRNIFNIWAFQWTITPARSTLAHWNLHNAMSHYFYDTFIVRQLDWKLFDHFVIACWFIFRHALIISIFSSIQCYNEIRIRAAPTDAPKLAPPHPSPHPEALLVWCVGL